MSSTTKKSPGSVTELFVFFSLLALQGFGGMIAFIEKGLVQKKQWMTREEFLEDWAVARTLPGPPAINMGIIIGSRHFGARGALAAVLGVFMFPSLLVMGLAVVYTEFSHMPEVVNALRGMGAVAAGLLIATGIKLLTALPSNVMGIKVCGAFAAVTFVLVGLFHLRVSYALVGLGGMACVYAYYCLRDKQASQGGKP